MTEKEIQAAEKKELTTDTGEFTREGVYFSPAVDIFDTEKELVPLADMPGVDPGQVEIDLRDNTLTLVGKTTSIALEGQPLLTEYRTGNYFRSFRITDMIDQKNITASMADGVLKLTLKKVEKAVPRKIPISAG